VAKEQTEQKKRPTIEILERRAQGIGVHGTGSPAIALKEPGWACRWFNSELSPDHVWRAKNQKGWEPVTPGELADPEQIGGFQTSPDGFVVRGEKGREVLLKMPSDYRTRIEAQKVKANIAAMDPHRQKADLATAAGKSMGDEAGSFIDKNVNLIGHIKTNKEVIHRGAETE
jgi:hypothetical protein